MGIDLNTIKKVAIFGASGAIGSNFIDVFQSINSVDEIHAFSRSTGINKGHKISTYSIDYHYESSIIKAKEALPEDTLFDLIIIATGALHISDHMPEKSLSEYSSETAQLFYLTNTIGPTLVMKHFWELLPKNKPSVMASLCARIGSISDNRLGGWYSYRASKAALAMMVKSASIEIRRRNKHAICVCLHPGTVDSPLSHPFHKHIDPQKIISPEDAVSQLLNTITHLNEDDTGFQFAYDGSKIPF